MTVKLMDEDLKAEPRSRFDWSAAFAKKMRALSALEGQSSLAPLGGIGRWPGSSLAMMSAARPRAFTAMLTPPT